MLSRARGAGFSVNPITLTDLASYLTLCGVCDAEERQDYLFFIQEMDSEFLEWASKKAKSK